MLFFSLAFLLTAFILIYLAPKLTDVKVQQNIYKTITFECLLSKNKTQKSQEACLCWANKLLDISCFLFYIELWSQEEN